MQLSSAICQVLLCACVLVFVGNLFNFPTVWSAGQFDYHFRNLGHDADSILDATALLYSEKTCTGLQVDTLNSQITRFERNFEEFLQAIQYYLHMRPLLNEESLLLAKKDFDARTIRFALHQGVKIHTQMCLNHSA